MVFSWIHSCLFLISGKTKVRFQCKVDRREFLGNGSLLRAPVKDRSLKKKQTTNLKVQPDSVMGSLFSFHCTYCRK